MSRREIHVERAGEASYYLVARSPIKWLHEWIIAQAPLQVLKIQIPLRLFLYDVFRDASM